ncbi:hypothetical protein PIB30_107816 [Stylosanthes scabra]|uniref:Uncharacterized protein n=1 Tax=Stylosanthes scabra TaxID=79078 RepID=A0ABU6TYP9_9FABA|nr:hypothetical protein [Stylosanthes scabra]
MARTKTTNRYTGAEVNPTSTRSNKTRASRESTPPQEPPSPPPPPTSAKPSSSRGKRPMTEEPAPPPPPPHPRVKRAAKRDLRVEKRALEAEERRARASSSHSSKAKGSGIKLLVSVVRELIQEVINMASCTSTAMDKSKSRAKVLEKYLNKLEDDHLFSEPEDEEDEDEHLDSLGEDDSDAS